MRRARKPKPRRRSRQSWLAFGTPPREGRALLRPGEVADPRVDGRKWILEDAHILRVQHDERQIGDRQDVVHSVYLIDAGFVDFAALALVFLERAGLLRGQ